MKRYITRHGQVAMAEYFGGNAMWPLGDPPLSELGRKQAGFLAKRLKEEGFRGRIVCSPYARALETAEIVADELDLTIWTFAPIREIMMQQSTAENLRGMTLEEIRTRYRHIADDAELPWPWWTKHVETRDDVIARVRAGLDELFKDPAFRDEEILFVSHGGPCIGLHAALPFPENTDPAVFQYNCFLSCIDPEHPEENPVRCSVSHIPYEMTTSNKERREDREQKLFAAEWEKDIHLPEDLGSWPHPRILHISDTLSRDYPFYRELVRRVKPDILLHTGDMADEVKVGRIPGTKYEYLSKLRVIADILNGSGAERVIIVPGNNDLPDDIRAMCPDAEVYGWDTVVPMDGVPCRLGHAVIRMTFDKKYAFYGHGLTSETWTFEKNIPGQPCRFNGSWGAFVCSLRADRFALIPLPGKQA